MKESYLFSTHDIPCIHINLQKNLPSETNRANESDHAGPTKPVKDIILRVLEDHESVLNKGVISLDLYLRTILLVTLWRSPRRVERTCGKFRHS